MLLPNYCQDLDRLTSTDCEALVKHAVRLKSALTKPSWEAPLLPFHQIRSVTWVKLVQGTWLLVAKSDRSASSLQLFSLSSLGPDSTQPPTLVSEVFLAGPVANGLTEVQDGVLIVALELRTKMWVICSVYRSFTDGPASIENLSSKC